MVKVQSAATELVSELVSELASELLVAESLEVSLALEFCAANGAEDELDGCAAEPPEALVPPPEPQPFTIVKHKPT